MKNRLSRRKFLKHSTQAAAIASLPISIVPSKMMGKDAPSNKLNIAGNGVTVMAETNAGTGGTTKYHWFGYYDKLAFDPSEKYVLGMEYDLTELKLLEQSSEESCRVDQGNFTLSLSQNRA